ncbi:hypothetical protein VTK56DRAFT_8607 [Thermocarpiscus australiensis]
MADHVKVCIFGDQTCDLRRHMKDLFQIRDNPAVEDFLVKAYNAVRKEIYKLPPDVRDHLPRFTGVNDLILYDQGSGRRCVAIDTVVTCIYQLAMFINQADSWYNGRQQVLAIGLCLGGLAAAAVSCSCSTLDLIPRAVDAVTAAFRTGMRGTETAKRLAPLQDLEESWSMLFSGSAASESLAKFCEQSALPLSGRPYVSASSPNTITVSGPPASLAQMLRFEGFEGVKAKKLPVFAPFHGAHLYSDSDAAEIMGDLGTTTSGRGQSDSGQRRFLSSTGDMIEGPDFAAVLKAGVDAIMVQPIRFDPMLDQLQAWIQAANPKSLDVVPIATTADRLVHKTLQQSPLRALVPPTPGPWQKPVARQDPSFRNPKTPKLAIIGMSGRFPGGANSTEAFWDLLYRGLDVHKVAPPLRWDVGTHVDLTGKRKNTGMVPYGCWLEDAGLFDARFFNISPREAPQIDPAQRLAMMTVYEAIERAGLVADATPSTRRDRVGVFYGVTGNDWAETNSAQDIDTYLIPGGNRAFIPGRINYFYKFSGPSYAIDTACSSAMSAFHLACNSLWKGDVDTAIAGGTNIMTNPDFHAGLDRGHFLSRTGNCKTFDDTADGYCRGEGVGTVIIKRLDDALADKDPILAVILDTYTNHSSESESITRPHVGAQRAIFNKLLNQAAVDPYSVSYVEMHGTGTQAGDATEMASVLQTFAPALSEVARARSAEEALYLGSAKANVGHGEASSGSSSLIKVLLMMQNNTIVPHCGIKTKINHKFPTDLKDRNVNIALKPVRWERSSDPAKPRRVLINNFSAAGGNSALLLEDAPLLLPESSPDDDAAAAGSDDPRSVHLVAVSAKSGASVQANLRSMLQFLRQHPDISLGQLSYTTTARRMHHQHRVMLAGSSADEISRQIETALRDKTGVTRPKTAPRIVFAFTGQGAQYPGMGRQLLQSFAVFRREIHRLDHLGRALGFPSIRPVLEADEQQDDMARFLPAAVQLASICMQIALCRLWASWGVTPAAVVGHSLGEYAALNAAGVLSDADTLYLVGKRAEFLQTRCTRDTHAMLVVRGSVEEIAGVLGGGYDKPGWLEVACINSPVETVLAGSNEAISEARTALSDAGMKTTLLKVPYAFHSSQLDPMLPDLLEAARAVTFSKPQMPIMCPLDGSVIEDAGVSGPEYLVRHSRQPVNMLRALQVGRSRNIITDHTTVCEIGPHPAMGGMVRAVLGSQVPTLASSQRGRPVWPVLATALKHLYTAGADIRWAEYHRDFTASQKVLSLPSYGWDLKDYWIPYVHDWSLRKGEPPLVVHDDGSKGGIESTTIHRIVEETELSADRLRVVVEADMVRPDLSPIVQGHEVDGIPLCTPSVYADIALSLGNYLLRRHRPGQRESLVDVSEMVVSKALILRAGAKQQLLQAHAEVDWPSNSAAIKFMSFDSKQKLQEHSRCTVRFRDGEPLQRALQEDVAQVKEKLQALQTGVATGATSRYNRAMCYRAIRPLARFHPDYQAVDEAILDSRTLECSSRLGFGTLRKGGSFHTHPAVIDALTQSCGFTMNCHDGADLDEDVYMNHGWGSLQLFEPIDHGKEYRTYTRMEEGADKLWHGDVVVLDGDDRVVAFFGQIAIQCVPRRILKVILSIESGIKSQKQPPAKQPEPAVKHPAPASTRAPVSVPALVAAASAPADKSGRVSPPVSADSHTTPSTVVKALSIIAEESGLSVADLTDSTVFADAGIDSLLGLTISARLKEELDLDLDFNALFMEYPTVGEFKTFFSAAETGVPSPSDGTSTPSSSSALLESAAALSSESSATSTAGDEGDGAPKMQQDDKLLAQGKVDFGRVVQIISEESGVAVGDLTDDVVFADAGVDSLLSLVIVSRFRDELDLDIQHESLFIECPTMAELKALLLGSTTAAADPAPEPDAQLAAPAAAETETETVTSAPETNNNTPSQQRAQAKADDALTARKKAVDEYVRTYTAGFSRPVPSSSSSSPASALSKDDESKVVLVTGASGSLGSHLTYHLAQLPDVKTVVCLNRAHRSSSEPIARQLAKMREKGIRFPDALKPKLLVLQTDSSQPTLGLGRDEYDRLAGSVTHVVHNAWPMSGKRSLDGFEDQFRVMRNLVQLACDVVARRGPEFRFGFQMVSSIGVVGLYGLHEDDDDDSWKKKTTVVVPEARLGIESVLPNGYGDAKWVCERMLDATLRQHPDRFRTMVVRLGQIAGSKTSGYWNPMEHIGFLIKSSQTLQALPDLRGTVRWTPVNDVAGALADLVLARHGDGGDPYPFYHIENPVGQPWPELTAVLKDALAIPELVPFGAWVERVRAAPLRDNPAATLMEFWDDNFLRMSGGGLVLDTKHALEHSPTLAAVGPVSEELVRKYIHIWKEIGFLR